jgi:hypothetical protein
LRADRGIEVSTAGEALDAGARGALVRVRNSTSGQTVRMRVVAPGTVEPVDVPMPLVLRRSQPLDALQFAGQARQLGGVGRVGGVAALGQALAKALASLPAPIAPL